MKKIGVLLGGLILMGVTATTIFAEEINANWAKSRVLLIKQFDRTGKFIRQGAGFFISNDGLFATSQQILGAEPMEQKGVWQSFAQTFKGTKLPIKATLAEDASTGVAVGIVELSVGANTPYLKFWDYPVPGKPDIWVIGHPKGKEWSGSKGSFAAYRPNFAKAGLQGPFIELTIPAIEGSEGAPVIGAKAGNVVGVYLPFADTKGPSSFASASENVLNLKLPNGTTIRENVQELYLTEALETYKKVMATAKTDHDRAIATNQLGVEYIDRGRTRPGAFDEAAKYFKKAIEFDPSLVYPHRNLADIYVKQKNKEGYLSELSIVEKLDQQIAGNIKKWWPSALTSN